MPINHEPIHEDCHQYIWHPMTQMKTWAQKKHIITERGDGPYLFDDSGNRYLDATSSMWCNMLGHGVAEIQDAIEKQAQKICHSGLFSQTNRPAIELAKILIEESPEHLSRVFYSDNGSTAVEVALKMAFQYWYNIGKPEKKYFAALSGAYHGDTLGGVGVGKIERYHDIFDPLLMRSIQLPRPHDESDINKVMNEIEKIIDKHKDNLAAVIIEPYVQGAAGIHIYPNGFMKRFEDLIKRYDILLIFDEVLTGLGRLGVPFAMNLGDHKPDFVALSKAITNGTMPLAATLTTDRIYEAFLGDDDAKIFYHGHTYTGYQLGCAVGLAAMKLILRSDFLEKLKPKIHAFQSILKKSLDHPKVSHYKQIGMVAGIVLKTPPHYTNSQKNAYGRSVVENAKNYHVLARAIETTVVLMPPPICTVSELDDMVAAILKAAAEIPYES